MSQTRPFYFTAISGCTHSSKQAPVVTVFEMSPVHTHTARCIPYADPNGRHPSTCEEKYVIYAPT